MAKHEDDDLLDALGLESEPIKARSHTPQEERIIAGFEDILRFYQVHGRVPQHGHASQNKEERDIFERLYAVRLDQLRKLPEARLLLAALDTPRLLDGETSTLDVDNLDEDTLLAELGLEDSSPNDITMLRHVRSSAQKQAAEEMAEQTPCKDFEQFLPLFQQVELDLQHGVRKSLTFKGDASIEQGNFFILGGMLTYVAGIGEPVKSSSKENDARLRVIYANGTESNMLKSSLQRTLFGLRDNPRGQRVTDKSIGPLFDNTVEPDDIETGTIYVLRSNSDETFVAQNRDLIHKIGVTGSKVATRISGAEHDATYLLAGVEVVAEYKLHNIRRSKLESLIHRLFATTQLALTIHDRFGNPVKPQEWFLVPLPVIDEAVKRIVDGSITQYHYDREQAGLVKIV